MTALAELPTPTDYTAHAEVIAYRGQRGGWTVYTAVMPLAMAVDLLPSPDPEVPFPNNRVVDMKHAREWADYWEANAKGWGCPALAISKRENFGNSFVPGPSSNGVTAGTLRLPRTFDAECQILDGQHRLKGWSTRRTQLIERLDRAKSDVAGAQRSGDEVGLSSARSAVRRIETTLGRLEKETISVEIYILTAAEHRTLFSKIANEAKRINRSQIADFDESQAVNKVAHALADVHPLLVDKVEWREAKAKDTKRAPSTALMSGDALTNVIRPFATGQVIGRVPPGRNAELLQRTGQLTHTVSRFLDALTESFTAFALDDDRALAALPSEIRADSLLGSTPVLRVLAAAYYRLTTDREAGTRRAKTPDMTHEEVVEFFRELNPHMGLPLDARWAQMSYFDKPEARAPGSRSQNLQAFIDDLYVWARGERGTWPFA